MTKNVFRELFKIDYDINRVSKKDLSIYYDGVYSFVQMDLKKRRSIQRQGLKINPDDTTSKFVGVHRTKDGLYIARILKDRIRYSLGSFENELDAAHAYDDKALELFGERAKTNFQTMNPR